jgi:hypothetical protein
MQYRYIYNIFIHLVSLCLLFSFIGIQFSYNIYAENGIYFPFTNTIITFLFVLIVSFANFYSILTNKYHKISFFITGLSWFLFLFVNIVNFLFNFDVYFFSNTLLFRYLNIVLILIFVFIIILFFSINMNSFDSIVNTDPPLFSKYIGSVLSFMRKIADLIR